MKRRSVSVLEAVLLSAWLALILLTILVSIGQVKL